MPTMNNEADLFEAIRKAININSAENESNTPDHVLAGFLMDALTAFNQATLRRDAWHGETPRIPTPDEPELTTAADPTIDVREQLNDIASMFRLAADCDGEYALAGLFEYLREYPAIVSDRPELAAIVNRIYVWVKE